MKARGVSGKIVFGALLSLSAHRALHAQSATGISPFSGSPQLLREALLHTAVIYLPACENCAPRSSLVLGVIIAYSLRSVTIGSTSVALCAGSQHAISATVASKSATNEYVNGSVAATPISNLLITLVSMAASPTPLAMPAITSPSPRPKTNFTMSRRFAPKAMRTPISLVRYSAV